MSPDELKARARRIVGEMLTQGDFAAAEEPIAVNYAHHVPVTSRTRAWRP